MVSEPNFDADQLKLLVQKNFDFEQIDLVFIPFGETSWCYTISTEQGKYFLKVHKDKTLSPRRFELTFDLFSKCGIKNLSHPVKNIEGATDFDFQGFRVVLFNFINGKTVYQRDLTQIQYEQLGMILGTIHNSKKIIGDYEIKENFANPFSKSFDMIFNALDSTSVQSIYQTEFINLVKQLQGSLMHENNSLQQLGQKLSEQSLEFFNCHGDLSPGNILIDNSGEFILIDWDNAISAPAEKDLFFFSDHLDAVLEGYKKIFPEYLVNRDILRFYIHLWNISEFTSCGMNILFESTREQDIKYNLELFKHFIDYSGII